MLTPATDTPGTGADVTVGYLDIPAVPAFQTVNVSQTITLPAGPPLILTNTSQFTISMVQDVDYLTNPMYPHEPTQGAGLDSAAITIGPGANADIPNGPTADLAAASVVAPTTAVHWGESFQVTSTLQNLGTVAAGPFNVVFVLTGSSGALSPAIFLGETTVPGLAAGFTQTITQTLQLPNRLPSGVSIPSASLGKVAMLIDPQEAVNEQNKSNNVSESNPITLRVLGTDGSSTVPNSPAVGASLGQPQPSGALVDRLAAARAARAAQTKTLLHRKAMPKKQSLTDKVETKLKVFPKQISKVFENLFH
jgi:hypothetical protein